MPIGGKTRVYILAHSLARGRHLENPLASSSLVSSNSRSCVLKDATEATVRTLSVYTNLVTAASPLALFPPRPLSSVGPTSDLRCRALKRRGQQAMQAAGTQKTVSTHAPSHCDWEGC